eukprot:m.30542 g.30542  ORF g.30542 m.30542 type:complete len:115 (-) comp16306_c0_seq1:61-405(-)
MFQIKKDVLQCFKLKTMCCTVSKNDVGVVLIYLIHQRRGTMLFPLCVPAAPLIVTCIVVTVVIIITVVIVASSTSSPFTSLTCHQSDGKHSCVAHQNKGKIIFKSLVTPENCLQ